ncbi:hypothetical protein [Natrinema sp. HArc-T2]|uniref:hypothetical protein n=1 Tax=Natrinema sp. HArc-T2 TaxID=3242701 RepID=UPI00359D7DF1
MPIQQLRLYDIIVDLLPGVIFIALLYPISDSSIVDSVPTFLSSGPVFAIILITAGYVLGRLIHSTTGKLNDVLQESRQLFIGILLLELSVLLLIVQASLLLIPFDSLSFDIVSNFHHITSTEPDAEDIVMYLITQIFSLYIVYKFMVAIRYFPWDLDTEAKIQDDNALSSIYTLLPAEYPDEDIDSWLKKGNVSISTSDSLSGPIEASMYAKIKSALNKQYDIDINQTSLPHGNTDLEWIRYIGYSKMFGKETLYQRYNILTTFFRNLSVVFWIVYLLYSFLSLISLLGPGREFRWMNWDFSSRYLMVWILFLLAISFSTQVSKYSKYRNRQFIADLYNVLN